jgi:hypothetical protein
MELQKCPYCLESVIPSNEGICPGCRQNVHVLPQTSVPATKPPPEKPAINPYSPPTTETSIPAAEPAAKGKEPFSLQAAKFSLYAPFILFLMGMCLSGQVDLHRKTPVGNQLAVALGGLSFLTTSAAFILGFVGFIGGIQRKSVRTIIYSALGIILNGGLVLLWLTIIGAAIMRNA